MTGPLSGLSVLDLSVGMAPALAAKLLVGMGAQVNRMEPPTGDPFYDVYPAYSLWRAGETVLPWDEDEADNLASRASLCLVGGEDHPGLIWTHDARSWRERYLHLTVLEFRGEPEGVGRTPAVDLLHQAKSGICFEQYTDRPVAYAVPVASYAAALHGLAAALAGVYAQRRGGNGRRVSTSLLQGALWWGAAFWLDLDGADAKTDPRPPKNVEQLIFRCSDGDFIQVTMGVPGALAKLFRVLGIESTLSETDRGVFNGTGPRDFFGPVDVLKPAFAARAGEELLAELRSAGLPSERLNELGECWDDVQTQMNNIVDTYADGSRGIGLPFTINASSSPSDTNPQSGAQPGALPLHGVRVVDCGHYVAGPYASVPLADLGAEVIKVEPLSGDPMRAILRTFAPANRGKRSIAIDAKVPEGRDLMQSLCLSGDVVSHNFRPGAAARLGIDHGSLTRTKADLIVLESAAYGAIGPQSALPGFDMIFQAIVGLEKYGGTATDPFWIAFSPVDSVTALLGAVGVTAALVGQTLGTSGAHIQTNLLNGGMFLTSELISDPDGNFSGMPRSLGDASLGRHPAERLYPASDGWIAVAARDDAMAARMLGTLGITGRARRAEWGAAEVEAITAATQRRTTADLLESFAADDVWSVRCERDGWAAVKDIDVLIDCGMVGSGVAVGRGDVTQVKRAFDLDGPDSAPHEDGLIDAVGGHSREILEELGHDTAAIDELIDKGAVRTPVEAAPA